MIYINLLPWRTQLQAEKKRRFLFLLLFYVITTVCLCLFLHRNLASQLFKQLKTNDYLTEQLNQVNIQITRVNAIKQKKNALLQHLLIINQLQTSRIALVTMFNDFVSVLPDGVYLTSIKKNDNIITLNGQSRSNQQVSELMKNVKNSASFEDSVLSDIQDNRRNDQKNTTPFQKIFHLSFEIQIKPLRKLAVGTV